MKLAQALTPLFLLAGGCSILPEQRWDYSTPEAHIFLSPRTPNLDGRLQTNGINQFSGVCLPKEESDKPFIILDSGTPQEDLKILYATERYKNNSYNEQQNPVLTTGSIGPLGTPLETSSSAAGMRRMFEHRAAGQDYQGIDVDHAYKLVNVINHVVKYCDKTPR